MLLNMYEFEELGYTVDSSHGEIQFREDREFGIGIDLPHLPHQNQRGVSQGPVPLSDHWNQPPQRSNDVWPNPKACNIRQGGTTPGPLPIENHEKQQKGVLRADMIPCVLGQYLLLYSVGVQVANRNIGIEAVSGRYRCCHRRRCYSYKFHVGSWTVFL